MLIETFRLSESSKATDHRMKILGIIFPDPGFHAGGIKERHIRENRGDLLTDGLGDVNQTVKNHLKILTEGLLKSCDFRGIRNLIEAAELAKVMRVMKEGQEHGIDWN